mmetsp:Transcript_60589/g.177128  ORF Transcript_60589/g.177128 Transcript_60589/m.177128 type:complete len:394 (+) Transcript_60589:509-1690(+)
MLASQGASQDNDHVSQRAANLCQEVAGTEEADVCILVNSSKEGLEVSAAKRGDAPEQAPVGLLRKPQLILNVLESQLRHRVAGERLHKLLSLEDLHHGLALELGIQRDRPRPVVQVQELRFTLHAALPGAVDLCTLEADDELTVNHNEQEVSVRLLVHHDHLVWQHPARLELPHERRQQPRRGVEDELPEEVVLLDGVEHHVGEGVGGGHAAVVALSALEGRQGARRQGLLGLQELSRRSWGRPCSRPKVRRAFLHGLGRVFRRDYEALDPVLLRDAARHEDVILREALQRLQKNMSVENCYQRWSFRFHGARQDHRNADERELADHGTASHHCLRLRWWGWLRWVLVEPDLLGLLLPVLRKELVLPQVRDGDKCPGVFPGPAPVRVGLVAEV